MPVKAVRRSIPRVEGHSAKERRGANGGLPAVARDPGGPGRGRGQPSGPCYRPPL